MISDQKIILFGDSDWWYGNPSSNMRLLRNMAKSGNDCLYINPIPMRMPKMGRSGSWRRYRNKLRSVLRYFKKADERIWVFSPIFIPGDNRHINQAFNSVLFTAQMKLLLKLLGWIEQEIIIIAATPTAGLVIPGMRRKVLYYQICDKFDKYRDITNQKRISELENLVIQQADFIITVSRKLHRHYKSFGKPCYYVPHGVDLNLFQQAMNEKSVLPPDLQNIDHPIIGYFGSITESNDKSILSHIAKNKPNWNIILIGEVISDYSSLKKFPNIHFLGKKKLEELPAYGKHFDVCIMNWIMSEWMQYCNPLKVKEYLAMGKPVVSVPIPEVTDTLGDVVSIASTPHEFLEKVEWELQNDNPERIRARLKKVANENWENKVEEICNLLENFLQENNSGRQSL